LVTDPASASLLRALAGAAMKPEPAKDEAEVTNDFL
jgi:hypothetical protein